MKNFELMIEEAEKEILLKLGSIFKDSLGDFSTSLDRSLKYLDKIIIPIIMASKKEKSYNPFAEIIEKYVQYILTRKFEQIGYSLLPLGYSSDLTIENDKYIVNIDIKTANIDNLSDFKNTVNIGINQFTHVAKFENNSIDLGSPFYIYPTIPPMYKVNKYRNKLVLTYVLMFIYPSYRELINNIREYYIDLFNLFNEKVKSLFGMLGNDKVKVITENLIRGIFIHDKEKENILEGLEIKEEEYKIIKEFSSKVEEFTNKLRELDIKPIAIISISLPNGILRDEYINNFISGKKFGESARYYYDRYDGIFFKVIKEEKGEEYPRVLFLDLNKNYIEILKNFFKEIYMFDYKIDKI